MINFIYLRINKALLNSNDLSDLGCISTTLYRVNKLAANLKPKKDENIRINYTT